jgi:probable HAF family extracellular repeat protein
MKKVRLLSVVILSSVMLLTLLMMSSLAETLYTFVPIEDYPGATNTEARGINQNGQIVGAYMDASGYNHGFLKDGAKFTSIDFPGSPWTVAHGINNSGLIVGTYTGSDGREHGFLKNGVKFTTVDYPKAVDTEATGVNNYGQIAGLYRDSNGAYHGFLKDGATFTSINCPEATDTFVRGINDYGRIIGDCNSNTEYWTKGFVNDGTTFIYLDYAELGMGINNRGQIVGCYPQAYQGNTVAHGFLSNSSNYSIFSDILLQGSINTYSNGINNKGEIVGGYTEGLDGPVHGYLATPKSGKSKN